MSLQILVLASFPPEILKTGKKKARILLIQALFLNFFRLPACPNNGYVGNNNGGGHYYELVSIHRVIYKLSNVLTHTFTALSVE
ncbi:hypothetical protein AB4560_11350 [Vibrio sp. 10N.222.51.C12]|uniref:hypothetical protein n=1 Tax=Vibrio sp. 10N.222.51.C12 TaxID=3229622 RepID=UPI0010551581|nr:hypothetical protein [Vibrio sp. 10N.286.48.B7]